MALLAPLTAALALLFGPSAFAAEGASGADTHTMMMVGGGVVAAVLVLAGLAALYRWRKAASVVSQMS